MYVKVNLDKPAGISPGSAAPKRNKVVIIDADDILVMPPRDGNSVNMVGNFVMKTGAKMIEFYVTKSKVSSPAETDGEEDSINIKQMFECQVPGNELPLKEFVQNWLGRNVIIIHESCTDNFKEVVGTTCAPLQMKPTKQDNNDGRHYALKFEQFAKSAWLPGHYTGEYIFAAPYAVADALNVPLDAENGYQYKLPATTESTIIAFDSFIVDHGKIITLIGQGGTVPAVLQQGSVSYADIILKSGTTWTALEGAVIQLQAYKAGELNYLIELSRS